MKKVAVLFADGMEEIEALTVVDLLRRTQIQVQTISITNSCRVHGSHSVNIEADAMLDTVRFEEYDMLVLPGGMEGTENLANNEKVRRIIEKFIENEKYIAAICMAPTVLGRMGLLKNRSVTCYPLAEQMLSESNVQREPVVQDEKIITGRGVGAAIDFSLKLMEILVDKAKADEIAGLIVR